MLDSINTILSILGVGTSIYDMVSDIFLDDNTDKILAELEKQTQLIEQQSAIQVERLSEHILYLPELQSVRDTSRTVQQIETDNQVAYDALRPVQQALGGDILSSAMILTPEQMRQAMSANPWDVLQDIQPAAHVRPHNNSGMVPILFEHEGSRFIGWQMRGVLPMLFNVEYSSLPSGLTVAETVVSPPAKIDFDWVHIPAGEFKMGSPDGQGYSSESSEPPQHTVYLDDYYISRTPVTNDQYAHFVKVTGHRVPKHWNNGNYRSKKANHPVVHVSWHDAQAFCKWAGVRLPNEAQWEKAARGTDGRTYPWGNVKPDKTLCNFNKFLGSTTQVGQCPKGATPYGCLDMAGNVWEWVVDWFDAGYYKISPERNPTGSEKGDRRVLRGGSWASNPNHVRAADRLRLNPDFCFDFVGFRVLL